MRDDETTIAQDEYSQTLTRLLDNPDALTTEGSTINRVGFLRQTETWIVQTIRTGSRDTGFVQHVHAEGGRRYVLPPEVMAALARQRDAITTKSRRRGARQAVATKRAKGGR